MDILLNIQDLIVFFLGPWLGLILAFLLVAEIARSMIAIIRGEPIYSVHIISQKDDNDD